MLSERATVGLAVSSRCTNIRVFRPVGVFFYYYYYRPQKLTYTITGGVRTGKREFAAFMQNQLRKKVGGGRGTRKIIIKSIRHVLHSYKALVFGKSLGQSIFQPGIMFRKTVFISTFFLGDVFKWWFSKAFNIRKSTKLPLVARLRKRITSNCNKKKKILKNHVIRVRIYQLLFLNPIKTVVFYMFF